MSLLSILLYMQILQIQNSNIQKETHNNECSVTTCVFAVKEDD